MFVCSVSFFPILFCNGARENPSRAQEAPLMGHHGNGRSLAVLPSSSFFNGRFCFLFTVYFFRQSGQILKRKENVGNTVQVAE